MRSIHLLHGAVGVLALGCAGSVNDLQDPSTKFHSASGYATLQHVSGDMLGMRADPITGQPSPAGVPYTERVIELGADTEFWPGEPTMLGTDVGMLTGLHLGYVKVGEIDGMSQPSPFLPITMGLTIGTALSVLRRPGLLVAVHSSLDLGLAPERLGDTAESPLVIYAGARAYYETPKLRTRLQYDFMPFWVGESRLEHRLTGLVSTHSTTGWAYGIRVGLEVGQKRLREGGLDDLALTIGVEVHP
jgi:hypothetical protein